MTQNTGSEGSDVIRGQGFKFLTLEHEMKTNHETRSEEPLQYHPGVTVM